MSKKKILIIDDEAAFTNIVKLTLELSDDYEVCVESNPCSALATARKFRPDIVLMDVIMPVMDGGELRTLFMAHPLLNRTPIIFLTAIVGQNEVEDHNGVIGGSFYLAKPVNAADLIKAIQEHIRS